MIAGTPARAAAALLAGILLGALAQPAVAQEVDSDRRARQLEVFERLLTETVQLRLTEEIEALEVAQKVVVDGNAEMVVTVDATPVLQLGRLRGAHGTYVVGHGLVFSLEAPPVALMPRPLALRLAEPFGVYEMRVGEGDVAWSGRVVEFRTHMIEESLRELEALLERERAGEGDPQRTAELLVEIEKLQANLASLQEKVAPEAHAEDAARETAVVAGEGDAVAPAPHPEHTKRRMAAPEVFEFYRGMVAEQRVLGEEMEKHAQRVAAAVREACIEALSQYGSVIKGLGDDERITLMVFPADSWGRFGTPSADEEVISVRYGDIRELDAGRIDIARFRTRVVINDRLGTPIAIEQQ